MNPSPAIRKVFQGVATRQQMFRMFDRHAQRPDRWDTDPSPLYAGEWFEIAEAEHDYMLEITRLFGSADQSSPCANISPVQ